MADFSGFQRLSWHRVGMRKAVMAEPIKYEPIKQIAWGLGYIQERYQGTPEQQAEAARRQSELAYRRLKALPHAREWWRKINASPNTAVRSILALHQPTDAMECAECFAGGPMDYQQDWPCRTIEVLADAIDLPVPGDLHLLKREDLPDV